MPERVPLLHDPMSRQRWRLTLTYDGGGFSGWQSQVGGGGVQDHLERSLLDLSGQPMRVHGAGRTDAGVHAHGQCVHFDAPLHLGHLNGANWRDALNTRLPASLRVLNARTVPPEFHSRFSASGKLYRYRIAFGPAVQPDLARVAWHRRRRIDPEEIRWLSQWMIGSHDFRRLSVNRRNQPATTTTRTIRFIRTTTPTPDEISIDIYGNGFLYKMVRMMVGSMVAVTEGKRPTSWLIDLFRQPVHPDKNPFCAPAHGLCLVHVDYPDPLDEP